METDGGGRQLRGVVPLLTQVLLAQQGGNHPRQHVPGAALGHAGVAGGVDTGGAVGGGGDGALALEDQHAAVVPGKIPGGGEPVLHRQSAPRQPGKFPLVGCEDGGGLPPVQYIYMPRQGVYAIGVQHHGNFQIGQQGQDKLLRLRGPPQSGADESRITAPRFFQNGGVVLRQREGHGLVALDGHDGADIPGHP